LRDNYPTVEIGRKMGGYDDRTGVFSLTQTKARYWCRKPGASQTDIIEYSAKLLREAGLQIVSVHGNYLEVKASPGQVWEALSGQPSDPERESYLSLISVPQAEHRWVRTRLVDHSGSGISSPVQPNSGKRSLCRIPPSFDSSAHR